MRDGREELHAALSRQAAAVRARDPADLPIVARAVDAVAGLADDLGLERFVGMVVEDAKPRLLLRFRVGRGGPLAGLGPDIALKVYGDQPRGEGPALALWHERGITTPRVRFGERAGCSWIALEFLRLTRPAPQGRAAVLDLTAALAARAARMHAPAPQLAPVLRPLAQVMLPRWDAAAQTLGTLGHEVPAAWFARTRDAYGDMPSALLHGDLGLPNVAHDPAGRLVVYDASALHGPVGFDAARWAARVATTQVTPSELVACWASVERLPSAALPADLVAAECVLEAGSRAVTASPGARVDDVRRLLDQASRLFGR